MRKISLFPIEGSTAFTRYIERIQSPAFDVSTISASDLAIVIDAASGNDFGIRLQRCVQERPEIKLALSKGAALLLDCCTEGPAFHQPSWEVIHADLFSLGLSGARVVYITNNHNFKGSYEKWATGTAFGAIAILPHNYFFRAVVNGMRPRILSTAERKSIVKSIFPSSRPRPARYVCLNHRLRGHRLVALGRLVRIGAFDSGHVSVLGGDIERSAVSLEKALNSANQLFPRFTEDIEAFKQLIERIPITIPSDTSSNQITSISMPLYSQAWFSLVNESEMTMGSVRRFTEKTIKPLLAGHPTLVAGNPGALSLLRYYGFETFSPYIDESYDAISDREERLMAVLEQFERLFRLSESEMSRLSADIWPIHDANFKHLEMNLQYRLDDEDAEIAFALRRALGACCA